MTEAEIVARILRIGFVLNAGDCPSFDSARTFLEEMRSKKLRPVATKAGRNINITWVKSERPIIIPPLVPEPFEPVLVSAGKATTLQRAEPRETGRRDFKDWSTGELTMLARKHGFAEQPAPNAGVARMRLLNFLRHKGVEK